MSSLPLSAVLQFTGTHCRRIGSASFGANPFEWLRAAVNPGLRQQRSSREIDAAKRTKDEEDSQSIFDTAAPEEEKTQQKDSTPSATGVARRSDHVRGYASSTRTNTYSRPLDSMHSTSTLRQISKSHTGNSTKSVVKFLESP